MAVFIAIGASVPPNFEVPTDLSVCGEAPEPDGGGGRDVTILLLHFKNCDRR